MSDNSEYMKFIPGLAQGITRVTISYPFDVVKVNMQKMIHNNVFSSFRNIYKNDPFKFYRGAFLSYTTVSFERSFQFYAMEKLNKKYKNTHLNAFSISLVSSIYSIPVQYLTTNISLKKIGTFEYIRHFLKNNRFINLYKGWNVEMPRNVINSTIFNGTYYYLRNNIGDNPKYSFIYGSFSGIICWLITFPIDTIRTDIQTMSEQNTIKVIKDRFINKGFFSFYRGLSPVLIRTIPSASLGMYVYEYVRNKLNIK